MRTSLLEMVELQEKGRMNSFIKEHIVSNDIKFQVERNVPVPASRAMECPYPFDEMSIGDSFLIPYDTDDPSERAISWNRAQGNVAASFRNWRMAAPKDRHDLMLTTRSTEDGLRCWLFKKPWAEQTNVAQLRA